MEGLYMEVPYMNLLCSIVYMEGFFLYQASCFRLVFYPVSAPSLGLSAGGEQRTLRRAGEPTALSMVVLVECLVHSWVKTNFFLRAI